MSNRQIISLILGIGFFSVFLLIVYYAFTSLSYQKIFKAYGYAHPGYAWIPFYRLYILADLTCGPVFYLGQFEIEKKYFVWWWLITEIIAFIPVVGSIISFILYIICLGFCYDEGIKKLDHNYDNKVLSYACALFGFLLWIIVLPKKVD